MAKTVQNGQEPALEKSQNMAEQGKNQPKIAEKLQNGADQGRFLKKIQAEPVEL